MTNLIYKNDLTNDERMFLETELNKVKKEKTPAWLLWVFLGNLGVHRLYMGDIGYGVAMFFLNWMTFGIWWVVDAFLINPQVDKKNSDEEMNLLTQIKMMRK